MKNIQISYKLFVALVEYHLAYDDDYAEEIHQGLEQKLDALVRHELYAKYKTAPPQKNGNRPGRHTWTNVEYFLIFDGETPPITSSCRHGQERVTLLFCWHRKRNDSYFRQGASILESPF